MKWFQLKILHRCLGTNVILKEIGVLDNNMCSFCNTNKDTIRHMFWQCACIQQFRKALTDTINAKCSHAVNFNMTEPLAITGYDINVQSDAIMYFIIMSAKQYIYKCKLERKEPTCKGF